MFYVSFKTNPTPSIVWAIFSHTLIGDVGNFSLLINLDLVLGIIHDLHAELYDDSEADQTNTCYLIALTTNRGMVKLDMGDDYHLYKVWATTVNHMLTLSTSFRGYELQFCKN